MDEESKKEKKDREIPPGGEGKDDSSPGEEKSRPAGEEETPRPQEKGHKKRNRISWKRSAIHCEEELARTKGELEETRERLLRRIAEFENFRRRVEEEKRALREEAKAWAFGEVLHLFDMLDMALDAAEKGGSVEDLVQGLRMVQEQWKTLLGTAGVEEVPGKGTPFDPLYHDAVQVHRTEEVPPGTVTQVLRKGYRMKNRVLRHAQVVVSERPRESGKNSEPKEGGKAGAGEKKAEVKDGDAPGKVETPPAEPNERAEPEGPGPQED